jgi:anthraniloyl-CoA monooxygenase
MSNGEKRSRPLKIAVVGGGPGGLYFAILMMKANTAHDITVFERNSHDDTFGFGVVFSDRTLENFKERDVESYDAITREFAYWTDIEVRAHGQTIRSAGHGFCGMERKRLLILLQERAQALGAKLVFQTEVTDVSDLQGYDLIVAADGVNSQIREQYKEHFQPSIEWCGNRFCWLGSTQPLPAFTFCFKENEHGLWMLASYQYNRNLSTWTPECSEQTWLAAGMDRMSEEESVAYLEKLFAEELQGHKLLTNRSVWRNFPTIMNKRWHYRNIVLIGDALHTAHYSIGSGTKLAMEDAIVLADAVAGGEDISSCLEHFERVRRPKVERIQHAANISRRWFENPGKFWRQEALQMSFNLLTRSSQVTYENLFQRDPDYIRQMDRWWMSHLSEQLGDRVDARCTPPPMFTPLLLRGLMLGNRVVASPLPIRSAKDGVPSHFHLVQLGSLALGGAGLVCVETAHVSSDSRATSECCGMYSPEQVTAWHDVTRFVHAHTDARISIQLGYAPPVMSRLRNPANEIASRPFDAEDHAVTAMYEAGMREIRKRFVHSAKLADLSGFDMIELNMTGDYLFAGFMSPRTNRRNDDYGGVLANRMRFPLEVFDAMRMAWPHAKPIAVRMLAEGWFERAGLSGDDLVEIAAMFKAHGCDMVDVSSLQSSMLTAVLPGKNFRTTASDAICRTGLACVAVGGVSSADQVNTILLTGHADLVELGNAQLANPHFTLQAAAHYGVEAQRWPAHHAVGKEEAYRLARQVNAAHARLRATMRPRMHRRDES